MEWVEIASFSVFISEELLGFQSKQLIRLATEIPGARLSFKNHFVGIKEMIGLLFHVPRARAQKRRLFRLRGVLFKKKEGADE